LQGVKGDDGVARSLEENPLKRVLLAAVTVVALGAFAAPASAGQACLTTTVTVNGEAAPTNGTNCVDTP
jgi:hypothetical protein